MKIMIVNDDGIASPGIVKLAKAAKEFGEVWVVAPDHECSAMSHRLTLNEPVKGYAVKDFPVEGVHAYTLSGTPTDCTRIGKANIVPGGPDLVLSGVNKGYNAGGEIQYSGTVAAALEAAFYGIPAIAFSEDWTLIDDVIDAYLVDILRELISKPAGRNTIWNVNFPCCSLDELQGILWERTASIEKFNVDTYEETALEDGTVSYRLTWEYYADAEDGSDKAALCNHYISIGKLSRIQ